MPSETQPHDSDVIDIDYVSTDAPHVDAQAASHADESTIGTGTSMALGCIAGTILLIGFGLLFLALSSLR